MELVLESDMESPHTPDTGFTLLELLVTVVIIGILASIAIPSFSALITDGAMSSSVNLFLTQLHLARSTAITRERRVTLCPASSPTACSSDHSAWNKGYLIFQDDNKNRQLDADEELISYQEKSEQNVQIVSSSRARNRISYRPTGRAWFCNTTVRFCHHKYSEMNRAIIISSNGRPRYSKRMPDGSPVRCQ